MKTQRNIALAALFAVLLSLIAVQAPVGARPSDQGAATKSANASGITGKINTQDLVLRAQPSTEAPKLAVLKAGDVVTVIGQTANGNWLQVTTADGQNGWVGSPYVVLSGGKLSDVPVVQAAATAEANGCGPTGGAVKGRVNTESLVIRREPSSTGEKLAVLKAGDQLVIMGQNKNTNWLLVQTKDNLLGWVGSAYVFLTSGKLVDVPIVDDSAAAAATAAPTMSATMAATPCPTAAATMSATMAATISGTASASASGIKGKVNTPELNVRNLPNQTAESLKLLKAGDEVTVIAQTKNGNWLQVVTADGIIGWVGSPYVVLSGGKLSDVPFSTEQ